MAAIEITGLHKRFGAMVALHALDLRIEDRQFVTLLGPSGCGKTTTLRLLAGLMEPDGGEITVGGRLLSSAKSMVPPERRGMGLVFQNYALWPHMNVFENVAFGLRLQRVGAAETRQRVEAMLSLVGLQGVGDRGPGALSGGQQQRVALARSLVTEPSILLLDEPLSNLDATLRERVRVELKLLQQRTGITFVYVTHDQTEAIALSDRIAVMQGGALQQFGTPREIYERPANRFVADFMGAANLLEGTVENGQVKLDAGPVLPAPAAHLASGARVAVMLRPEDIVLRPAADSGALRGTVTGSTYLGSLTEYLVAVGTASLRVQVLRGVEHAPGTVVALEITPQNCVVLT